jgi:AmiR/NasT family two-component response regulator
MPSEAQSLRVILADEQPEAMGAAREVVSRLGHELVGAETDVRSAAEVAVEHDAEVAVVSVHTNAGHALELIEELNDRGPCPVVLLLDDEDAALVAAAAERGLDAYATAGQPEALQAAIELARRRFARTAQLTDQLRGAEAAAARRQLIDRATGVVMERHDLDAGEAYERLRREARRTRISLVELAESVLRSRPLLPGRNHVGDR